MYLFSKDSHSSHKSFLLIVLVFLMVITLPELPVVYHTEHFTVRNVVASTFDCRSFCMALFFQNPSAILWSFSISSLTVKNCGIVYFRTMWAGEEVTGTSCKWNLLKKSNSSGGWLIDWLLLLAAGWKKVMDACWGAQIGETTENSNSHIHLMQMSVVACQVRKL